MATLSQTKSQKKYSWWWDSHISPKNSRWLQENLTDMDSKVKSMIKLIEEDADSFARRAEMYYKKRPELMKLVEEFYRAYRALAERYDHATGALRQAHRTMSEAFPNQMHMMLPDDSPGNSACEADPRTPDASTPVRSFFDSDDLHKNDSGLSHSRASRKNGAFREASEALKQVNSQLGSGEHAKFAEGRVRKGLNFQEDVESELVIKSEREIATLKEAIAKLEAEKEASQKQHQQHLESLLTLEAAVARAQEDSREFSEKASKAEVETQALKDALIKLEAEKEASLLQYQLCLDNISNLENILQHAQKDSEKLDARANKAETEVQSLKQDLAREEVEKDDVLNQYKQSLELVSVLENKLLLAEGSARKHSERAELAEGEVETLKQAILKLNDEKEAVALQYQQCLETISCLELKISGASEETRRLNDEINNINEKLKIAEEQCALLETSNHSLHSELENAMLKMGNQNLELTEKQKELAQLWECVQEERLRFVEAETAFQTLQFLHSQAQDELRSLALELHNRSQTLRDMETHNESLQEEILKIKEENKGLNELNQSSTMSMEGMQNEIFSLRQMTGKLEEEVELRVDQRNALQQEIYCLKQELKDLNDKQHAVLKQVEAVGFNPEGIEVSVKKLQDENSNLSEMLQKEKNERVALIQKLEIFDKLLEKNTLLENSLADLSVELEAVKGKIIMLEESCESLLLEKSTLVDEKATVMTQLQLATDNLGKLSETNTSLQISLSSAHNELEEIKAKTKSLEDSCMLLVSQKSSLMNEKDALFSEFEITHQRLEDSEKRFAELEENYLVLEKEKISTLSEANELKHSLKAEKQRHDCLAQTSARQLAGLTTQIQLLQEERWSTNKELGDELDNALNSQLEIFILRRCVQDLGDKNVSLSIECQKLLEAYKVSGILLSQLEQENAEQKVELKSLCDQLNTLRFGMSQLLMACDIVLDHRCEYKNGQGVKSVDHILRKFQDTKRSLVESEDENQLLRIELSVLVTLLKEMRSEAADIAMEKSITDQELTVRSEQYLMAQSEARKLFEATEMLRLELVDGCQKEKELTTRVENLTQRLLDNERAYATLQDEKTHVLDENRVLVKDLSQLEKKNCTIEEENFSLLGEMLSINLLSLIFKNYLDERSLNVIEIGENLSKLHLVNTSLEKNLDMKDKKLEDVQTENQHLQETVQKSMDKLQEVTFVVSQLSHDIETIKNLLHQKEMELLEAEQKLSVKEDENSGLTKIMEDLKSKDNRSQMIIEDMEKKIVKLEEDNNHLSEENKCLDEANQNLEGEYRHLHDTHETTKYREVSLCSEMQKRDEEIDMWEKEAGTFYGEFQTSTVAQTLFLEKVHELIEECGSLRGEIASKDVKMELLAKNISTLESKNEELEARFAPYGPAVTSLMDSISSLEKNTFLHAHLEKTISEEVKDANLANQQLAVSDPNEDNVMVPDAILNMQHLKARVKAIENTIVEMESLAMEENLHLHTKLEAALKQINEMSSENHEHAAIIKHPTSEISEETGLLPKDIMLDHISETSSYGISKRRYDGSDIQVHELWETTDQESSIDLTGGKGKKIVSAPDKDEHSEATKQKREHFSSDSLAEKAFGVDKLDISKRFTQPHQDGNKRKVLERLNSDVQKLTNLQITVQDLKRKLESIEKSRKGKAAGETDAMKKKLEEAEAAIQKLFDFNGKLMKNIEDKPSQSGQKSAMESEESGSTRRKRISEQALRVSERIGRLQLEIQRIQFELLKLDDGKESKGKIRIVESKRRVLLRDYLYGGIRKNPKRKKAPFCACVEPRTKED